MAVLLPFFASPVLLALLLLSCSTVVLLLISVAVFRGRSGGFSRAHDGGAEVPQTYPVLGCLVAFCRNKHRLLDWYTECLAASPTQTIVVRRLGARRTVVTANPKNVEHMLRTNFGNYPKGKPFTDLLGDLLGCGIFNADGDLWHAQRKLASHEFTTRSLRELVVGALEAETDGRLVPFLGVTADQGRVVDLQEILRRFAFDTICMISLGTDPGCLEPSLPDSSLAAAFDTASEICARRGASPVSAVWKLKRALGIGSERVLREKVGLVQKSVMELIRRRKAEEELKGKPCDDFLSRLISGGHDVEVVRDMVISFIMAGRDTTSSALTWFFWLLSRHADIEQQVRMEVAQVKGRLDYHNLKEMRVLEACLYESMRLYPPVAWDSKHAATDDVLPDGTRVGRGDRVTYFPYGMGRMETLWGKDAAEFRPGRWHLADPNGWDQAAKVSPFKYPVFQGGPRVCLGKEMAFVQMKYVAAAVLQRFELRPVDDGSRVFVPLLTAHMAGGLRVVARRRDPVHDSAQK
ncbi:hypothetical protein Taro_012244 [Colocasia esculenta]|uniref:Cytochrome P450 94B3 n=1 Tax=Colocasia esculenta TaxID=4460 RepID=A0A843UCB6_COLES|nr:hypothetical protein [Colocasia esculenta]